MTPRAALAATVVVLALTSCAWLLNGGLFTITPEEDR